MKVINDLSEHIGQHKAALLVPVPSDSVCYKCEYLRITEEVSFRKGKKNKLYWSCYLLDEASWQGHAAGSKKLPRKYSCKIKDNPSHYIL